MERAFEAQCQSYLLDGLKAALLTDRDGVIILKCIAEDAPPKITDPLISTNFAVANNQASKLGLKRNELIVSMYGLYQLVQLDQNPLIITIISDASANTGAFMQLARQLKSVTDPLVDLMQTGGHLTSVHQE